MESLLNFRPYYFTDWLLTYSLPSCKISVGKKSVANWIRWLLCFVVFVEMSPKVNYTFRLGLLLVVNIHPARLSSAVRNVIGSERPSMADTRAKTLIVDSSLSDCVSLFCLAFSCAVLAAYLFQGLTRVSEGICFRLPWQWPPYLDTENDSRSSYFCRFFAQWDYTSRMVIPHFVVCTFCVTRSAYVNGYVAGFF